MFYLEKRVKQRPPIVLSPSGYPVERVISCGAPLRKHPKGEEKKLEFFAYTNLMLQQIPYFIAWFEKS